MSVVVQELIALVAGVLCLGSALPQILRLARGKVDLASHSLARNLMLVAGNAAWTAYALTNDAIVPVITCAIGTGLNAIICAQLWRARRRARNIASHLDDPKGPKGKR